MKLGILTFPDSTSYGAVLQMYALYRATQQLGAQPEIIHYHNSYMKDQRHTVAMQGKGKLKLKLRLYAKNMMHIKQKRRFVAFEKQLSLYPRKPISRREELCTLKDRYDGVICGSDQVWNPDITGCDSSYFLDFCGAHTKRIAYAPSFGISEFTPEFKQRIEPLLQQFHTLSVREMPGKTLVEELTGKTVPLVLDPTFLLQQQDWQQLEQPHSAGSGDYILYYKVRRSESLLKFCLRKAAEKNMKVVYVGGNAIKQAKNRDPLLCYAYDLSPGQFLYLIHHAKYVVTNSFHGTAFSIHYKKDFFLELSSLTNSRLQQIVETTGLQGRVIGDGCMDRPIDYDEVYRRLEPERVRSAAYLKEAL